jgi:hypothetical protein
MQTKDAAFDPILFAQRAFCMNLREAPWSAVAAATAFRPWFIREWYENQQGGSCCHRTPRYAIHFTLNVNQKNGEPSFHPLVERLLLGISWFTHRSIQIVTSRDDPFDEFHFFHHQQSLSS